MTDLVDVEQWRRWLRSRRGNRCWQQWAEARPSLADWTVEELERPPSSPRTDRLQHDLVALAQTGQGDAAVTLLVQLRPGLFRLVRLLETRGEQRAEACDEVRAVFNETLCRHRLDRRPERIAANLVLDTRQRIHRSDHRPGPIGPLPIGGIGSDEVVWPDDPVPAGPILRRAIDRLPASPDSRAVTAEAAYRAWILDQPQTRIAGDLGLEPAAVASRLHRLRPLVRQEWDRAA